jgi:hypothetical protein
VIYPVVTFIILSVFLYGIGTGVTMGIWRNHDMHSWDNEDECFMALICFLVWTVVLPAFGVIYLSRWVSRL